MTAKFNKLDVEVQRAKDRGLDLDARSDEALRERFEDAKRCGTVKELSTSCKRRLLELGFLEKHGRSYYSPGHVYRGRVTKHAGEVTP